jgi:ABC-type dipeptide/oligopeptide/nickel transport system ATPase component
MKKTTVINIYGGSGVGKSITAARLYAELDASGRYGNVELCREYSKDLVWKGDMETLSHQPSVTAGQIERQAMLYGKVDFIVTDSPVRLGYIYSSEEYIDEVSRMIEKDALRYRDVNILLKRSNDIPFDATGRVHTLQESIRIDNEIEEMLKEKGLGAELFLKSFQLLPGALEYASMALLPAATYDNEEFVSGAVEEAGTIDPDLKSLLLDPQTSGGLLMSVSPGKLAALLEALSRRGVEWVQVVGRVKGEGKIILTPQEFSPEK